MHRIIIVTIYDSINYGNRLQNLSTTILLRKLGFESATIDYIDRDYYSWKFKFKRFFHTITHYQFTKDSDYYRFRLPKELNNEKIDNMNIKRVHISNLFDIPEADYYLLGSDQVWNTTWYDDNDLKQELFLLSFADTKKRACIAPSFGTEKIPTEWESYFTKELNKFNRISVREHAGANIIQKLTGKEAFVMLDPTLMVDTQTWQSFEQKPKWLKNKSYIVTYFLGGLTESTNQLIYDLNKDHQYEVYHLMELVDRKVYSSNYLEFIYLIHHADLVLTDSFHACVFSFLFNRPFVVFDRAGDLPNMNSRIETLLSAFSLDRKYFNSGLENDLFEHNYEDGYKVLESKRKESYDFLKDSLIIKNEE